jgi:para-aminobenzoate synthetase/4-amino-4-deoxychorismate lyase
LINSHDVCVFLDTARPSAEQRYSFVFVKPSQILTCASAEQFPAFLETLDEMSKENWLAGYVSYEAAYGLEQRFSPFIKNAVKKKDLAWFGVFGAPYIFDHFTGTWNIDLTPALDKSIKPPGKPAIRLRNATTPEAYSAAINKIRRFIAAGDVYQVNFTYDLSVASSLHAWDLYKHLRNYQPVPFGAFIKTGSATVASFSPELFFMKQERRIITRPMKGTARRGRNNSEDALLARALATDPKNRSENVMIVDLLRNDLGKICKTGTVATTKQFDVERHPTVLQMTSTVEGVLDKDATLSTIFRALFPCGSVTGAPKIRAMEIIRDLEKGDRGVYCGAIGYSSPQGRAVFSVPIRTLQKKKGAFHWCYRVGSGIVGDSRAKEEWRECGDKCRFLTGSSPDFKLFESILFDGRAFLYGNDHKKRLLDAAKYFGFHLRGTLWDATTKDILAALIKINHPQKVRVVLDKSGKLIWDGEPVVAQEKINIVHVARKAIDTDTPFLFHKTTFRPWYDNAMTAIRNGDCFDVLHFNKKGQLTEGARSNVFLKIKDELFTPPVECGLLPGVLRGRLLKNGKCKERVLKISDIKKADAVYCGNSVRGLVEVTVAGVKKKLK